jgi:quercetin dioxygenase-like cupin family protein
MQALSIVALLLAATPSPKTLVSNGPVKLLEVVSERPVPLLARGAEVVVLVEGAALIPIQPGKGPLQAGDSVFAPTPGKWWLTPQPRVRAVILAFPTPPGVSATAVRSVNDLTKYRILGGQGEVTLVLDKSVVATDAFSQQHLTLQPGAAVPSHQHTGSAELIYVVSGKTEATVEGATRALGPSEALWIPAGAQHAAKVVGKEPLVVVQFYVPGGPEQRYRPAGSGGAGGGTAGTPDAGPTSGSRPR